MSAWDPVALSAWRHFCTCALGRASQRAPAPPAPTCRRGEQCSSWAVTIGEAVRDILSCMQVSRIPLSRRVGTHLYSYLFALLLGGCAGRLGGLAEGSAFGAA